jgi:hypothetical protein
MPRLPVNSGIIGDTNGTGSVQDGGAVVGMSTAQTPSLYDQVLNGNNEFNITNFMFDASTDWLGT